MRALLLLGWLLGSAAFAAPAPVELIVLEGAIGPGTADYVQRGLERAAHAGAQLVVLRLDTPGGLDTSMRAIVKDILASPVPVAAYVAPGGARAASAGTFILYASHVAAMAPATNLGAATPVALSGGSKEAESPSMRKAAHDAAAYIRGLAELRGRNADWAAKAVTEAASLPASEALKLKVVDLLADDVPQLLEKLDGRMVQIGGKQLVLKTRGVTPSIFEADWRARFLAFITDPTFAYALLLLGVYGIFFEFMNPGMVLPGVVGVLALLLAAYALHLLPVSYAGLALLLLGIGLMGAELFFPAYGSLGVGGAIAFVVGSVMLIDTDVPGFGLPLPLVLGVAAGSAAFLLGVAALTLRARKLPVVSGRETLVGETAEVMHDFAGEGWARVQGETWRVRSAVPLKGGARVRVAAVEGLILEVKPERQD